ncbi:MAG: tail fiber domain-containing protein [Paracoccaceae bacterium]
MGSSGVKIIGKPKAPKPPDPKDTSAAATGTSVGTSIANTMMGNVNQVGPTGSLTYDQTGTYDWTDPYTGKSYKLPTFTATTSLAPDQQNIHNINTQTQTGLAEIGRDQTGFLQDYLGENREILSPDEAMRSRYEDALMERMQPRLSADREAMETRLANQGITLGSRAYSAADRDYTSAVNDARLGAIGAAGNEQARDFQVRSAARNQPINEIMALLSGSQVQMPNFGMNQPSQIPTTDNAGIINQDYNNRMGNYNAKMGAWNQGMGGLFGMGAALLSDERAKEDIREVGKTEDGLPIYTYRYKGDPTTHMGVMAQEARKKQPGAVKEVNGVLGVDYEQIS